VTGPGLGPEEFRAVQNARHETWMAAGWLLVMVLVVALVAVGVADGGPPWAWGALGAAAAVTAAAGRDWWKARAAARQVRACGRCRRHAMTAGGALAGWARCADARHDLSDEGVA